MIAALECSVRYYDKILRGEAKGGRDVAGGRRVQGRCARLADGLPECLRRASCRREERFRGRFPGASGPAMPLADRRAGTPVFRRCSGAGRGLTGAPNQGPEPLRQPRPHRLRPRSRAPYHPSDFHVAQSGGGAMRRCRQKRRRRRPRVNREIRLRATFLRCVPAVFFQQGFGSRRHPTCRLTPPSRAPRTAPARAGPAGRCA